MEFWVDKPKRKSGFWLFRESMKESLTKDGRLTDEELLQKTGEIWEVSGQKSYCLNAPICVNAFLEDVQRRKG